MSKPELPPPYEHELASPGNIATSNQPQVTHINISAPPQGRPGATCPVCHNGQFEGTFTIWGWLCCFFCFPCGILFCLCMRKKKCNHCGFMPS